MMEQNEGRADAPVLLTARQAAEYLNIPIATLRAWSWRRRMPVVRLGRKLMFKRVDLEKWIDAHACKAKE